MNASGDNWTTLPETWKHGLESRIEKDESLLAWFESDLDEHLRYVRGLVVLTDRRLLAIDDGSGRDWRWRDDLVLRSVEQGGAGSLELHDDTGRLALFRHTAARARDAARLVQRRDAFEGRRRGDAMPDAAVCPSCGAVIDPNVGACQACSAAAAPNRVSSLLRLSRYAKRRWKLILLGFVLTIVGTAFSLVPPYMTRYLLDDVLIPVQAGVEVDSSLVVLYLGGLTAAAVLTWLLDWGRVFVLNYVGEYISADLRLEAYTHLQSLSLEYYGGKRTGDLISRVKSDSERLCNFLSLNVVDFGADVVLLVMASALLLQTDVPLALTALLPFPFITALAYWVRGKLLRNFRRAGVAESDLTSVLADTIPGIRVVKAFAQEPREIERFDRANSRYRDANNRTNVLWSFFSPTVALLTSFGVLLVWWFACQRAFDQLITIGVITMFIALIARFYGRIESMIRMVSAVQRAAAAAQRVFEILDRVPSVPEPTKPVSPGRLQGRIELKGVRFKYGTREVLHGLDLVVEPGEMIGLVGPSGAGKSTLVNLVCRFYDVASGAILADGVDIRSYPVREYRRNIGIVLQEPFLFFGTIADNIAYGRPEATREEIAAAARAARAHEFILKLPNGYDSLVGERGQSLSGGERQRISIARALLMDPRLLILDEATSSVDTETEREIQTALENLTRGRTTIAIAHRLSTLKRASRLVVVQNGEIVEVGPHDELLALDGAYARLHHAQMELAKEHAI